MAAWNAAVNAAAFGVPVNAGFTEYPPYGFPAGSHTVAGRIGSLSAGMPPGMPGSQAVRYISGRIDSSIAPGAATFTAAESLFEGSATLVATTWKAPEVAGATYLPAAF